MLPNVVLIVIVFISSHWTLKSLKEIREHSRISFKERITYKLRHTLQQIGNHQVLSHLSTELCILLPQLIP